MIVKPEEAIILNFTTLDELNTWFRGLSKEEKRERGVWFNREKTKLENNESIISTVATKIDLWKDPEAWVKVNHANIANWKIQHRADGFHIFVIEQINPSKTYRGIKLGPYKYTSLI